MPPLHLKQNYLELEREKYFRILISNRSPYRTNLGLGDFMGAREQGLQQDEHPVGQALTCHPARTKKQNASQ